MNIRRDHEAVIGAWLDDGPQTLPAETRQAITVGIRTVTRHRAGIAWPFAGRGLPTIDLRRLSVALGSAAVVVVAAALALNFYANRQGIGGVPSQSPTVAPLASPSPRPSPSPGFSRFSSAVHEISIDYPSGWQTRPATEPWVEGELNFDSPAADVIFDPTLGDSLYLVIASQPLGGLSEDAWRDEQVAWLCTGNGGAMGWATVDGANAFVITCGSTHSAALIFTDTRGFLIRLVVSSDEPGLAETYDWDWHKAVLETVDLQPEEAFDALSPSDSP